MNTSAGWPLTDAEVVDLARSYGIGADASDHRDPSGPNVTNDTKRHDVTDDGPGEDADPPPDDGYYEEAL